MRYKLAIFDLDGTILNTIDDLADSMNYVLAESGYPVHTTEEIKYMVGNGIPKLVERALPDNVQKGQSQKVLESFVSYYDSHCSIKTAPYPEMLQTLQKLKSQGIKLAVNSNKLHEASVFLCQKYFPGIFDIVCGNQPGIGTKPSPDGVYKIMKQLDFSQEDLSKIVFIGDSDVDCKTAENAQISFIGCDWGFRGENFLRQNGAKTVIKSPKDILSLCL